MSMDEPIEWTAEESARLDSLARELVPDPVVEARTIAALRRSGLLGNRDRGRGVGFRVAVAAAAAAFVLGVLIGRQSRPNRTGGSAMAAEADSSRATVTWIVGI
jgi:hypothetical protein